MKRGGIYLLVCLAVELLAGQSAAQVTLEGIVRDRITKAPLPYASVFINQTTRGSLTDDNGHYIIHDIPVGPAEIVCSYVGYETFTRKVNLVGQQQVTIDIAMTASAKQLTAVEVVAERDKEWESQLRKFQRHFLGESANAKECRILNSGYLEFKEEKTAEGKMLSATSSQPLEIDNQALGYRVTYFLSRFEITPSSSLIQGKYVFREQVTTDPALQKKWAARRAKAYEGSLSHFLTSLVTNRVEQEGFNLYFKYTPPPYRLFSFARELDKTIFPFKFTNTAPPLPSGVYRLYFDASVLEVHYTRRYDDHPQYPDVPFPVSWLEIRNKELFVNARGTIYNPGNLILYGAMNDARIADLLPSDYGTTRDMKPAALSKEFRLRERPFVHVDRYAYYPGDKIWFSVFMNYGSMAMRDSLSKLLTVDLTDDQGNVVDSKICKLKDGVSAGSLWLPDTLRTATYYLRAYTNWSLNFGTSDVFVQPLPVLPPGQLPEFPIGEVKNSPHVKVKREEADGKEKLLLNLVSRNGEAVGGQFSLSITAESASVPPWAVTTLPATPEKISPPKSVHEFTYPIEHDLTYTAEVKKRPNDSLATVMISFSKDRSSVFVETDRKNRFTLTVEEADTSTVFFRAFYPNGKWAGHVAVEKRATPTNLPLSAISFTTHFNVPLARALHSRDSLLKNTMLKEVVIRETKVKRSNPLLTSPDVSVENEALNRIKKMTTTMPQFLRQLAQSIPGGIYAGYSFGFTSGTSPAAIFINGMYYQDISILDSYQPANIIRVEIFKPTGGANGLGQNAYGGALNFITSETEPSKPSKLQFDKVKLVGYAPPDRFVPASNEKSNPLTILWAPASRCKKDGVTIQLPRHLPEHGYRIVIEGITDDGEPFFYQEVVP